MALIEVIDEKRFIQEKLLDYEKVHGTISSGNNREYIGHIYERYRGLLRSINRQTTLNRTISGFNTLASIPEDAVVPKSSTIGIYDASKTWSHLQVVQMF